MPSPHKDTPAVDVTASLEEIQKATALLQYQELVRQRNLRTESENQAQLSRENGIAAFKQRELSELAKQNNCNHRKENGRTHLAGQRDHSGTINLICQYCQKLFRGNQIPLDLAPPLEHVGGPHNG